MHPPASDPFTTGPPYRGSVARGLAAASQFALRAHPTRRLHIPQPKAVREADALAGVRGRIPAPQLRATQRLYICQGKHLGMRLRRINRPKAALITAKQRHLIVVEKREAVKR